MHRLALAALLASGSALAQAAPQQSEPAPRVIHAVPVQPGSAPPPAEPAPAPAPTPQRELAAEPRTDHGGPGNHVAVLATLLGAPRPFALELLGRLGPYVGLGAHVATLPSQLADPLLALAGANSNATTSHLGDLTSYAGDLRLYPFGGAFSLGALVGYQHFQGSITKATTTGTESAAVDISSTFVTPRLGWQWVSASGLSLGVDLGVQITASESHTITLPPAASVDPNVRQNADSVVSFFAHLPLPTLDLVVGYQF